MTRKPLDERALHDAMRAYLRGDQGAFAVLDRGLRPRLIAFFVQAGNSVATAEDLVQETFLRIHRARDSYVDGRALLPWVYAIARNLRTDHARASTDLVRRDARGEAVGEWVYQAAADAETMTLAAERARDIEQALQRIPVQQRAAFVRIHQSGLSAKEAAAELKTTAVAVKLRASRAMVALRGLVDFELPSAPLPAAIAKLKLPSRVVVVPTPMVDPDTGLLWMAWK
jgi:RNA polymerase sigma-70 factor, ECF subfamily